MTATGDEKGVDWGRKGVELLAKAQLLSAPPRAALPLTLSVPAGRDALAGESAPRMSFLRRRSSARSPGATLPAHCACSRVPPALALSLLAVLLAQPPESVDSPGGRSF